MSFNLNIFKLLKKYGYAELNPDTPQTGTHAHVVYLTNDEEGNKVYCQSTRAVRHVFSKYISYLKHGKAKYLPAPLQRNLTWSHVQFPELHVKVFYRKDIFINPTLEDKLTKITTMIAAKERDSSGLVDVLKLSIKGVPGYKLVSTRGAHSKAIAQFIYKSKELVTATYKVSAKAHQQWAITNRAHLTARNVECEVLVKGLLGGAAGAFIQLWLDGETNRENILNYHGAV